MNKTILALGISFISGAAAAAGAFDGPYVQLAIGGASTQTESNYNTLGLGNRNSNEGAVFYKPNQNYGWVGVGCKF